MGNAANLTKAVARENAAHKDASVLQRVAVLRVRCHVLISHVVLLIDALERVAVLSMKYRLVYCAVIPAKSPAGLLREIKCAVLLTSVSTMNAAPLANPSWRMMGVLQSAVLRVKSPVVLNVVLLTIV